MKSKVHHVKFEITQEIIDITKRLLQKHGDAIINDVKKEVKIKGDYIKKEDYAKFNSMNNAIHLGFINHDLWDAKEKMTDEGFDQFAMHILDRIAEMVNDLRKNND